MISFIVIGKNEGLVLEKCFNSIVDSISKNHIHGAEIIFVDSNSEDDSVSIALNIDFERVSVFEITGDCNAAIARNIGANNAKNNILFFIDGDMEVYSSFLKFISLKGLQSKCITGHIIDYLYTHNWEFVKAKNRTFKKVIPEQKRILPYTGGIFVINKIHWQNVNGMRNKYKRSQDLDLFLRLRHKGVQLEQMPSLIAKHHTIDYNDENRMWRDLISGKLLYEPLLLRDHIFSTQTWKRTLRGNYTAFFLILTLFTIAINFYSFFILFLGYCLMIVIRSTYKTLKMKASRQGALKYFISRFFYQFFRDLSFILGLFLFFPIEKTPSYSKIR
jgi:glycosyltransferase involved in cell wall biosynthesis